jgi:regulator of protease activity HflC (stomatin/prohibitin superfamily)
MEWYKTLRNIILLILGIALGVALFILYQGISMAASAVELNPFFATIVKTMAMLAGTSFVVKILFSTSLREVPVAHLGVVTFLGKRTQKIEKEGLTILLPLLEDMVEISIKKKRIEMTLKGTLTPEDDVEIIFNTSVWWRPNPEKAYEMLDLDSPPEEHIKSLFSQAIRTIVQNERKILSTFEQAKGVQDGFLKELVEALCGHPVAEGDLREIKAGRQEVELSALPILVGPITFDAINTTAEFRKSLEKIGVEKAQRRSEIIEAQTKAERILVYLKKLGVSDEELKDYRKLAQALDRLGITIKDLETDSRIERGKSKEAVERHIIEGLDIKELAIMLTKTLSPTRKEKNGT